MKTRITFLGESHWSAILARGLNDRFKSKVDCSVVRMDERWASIHAFSYLLRDSVIVRVGFPPSVLPEYEEELYAHRTGLRERTKRCIFRNPLGRALRKSVLYCRLSASARRQFMIARLQRLTRWLRPGRRDYLYWIGTDVLNLRRQFASGSHPAARRQILASANIAGADHLVVELSTVGVDAIVAPFPGITLAVPEAIPAMPARMTVISYTPTDRREFYGLPALLEAARSLPDVRFRFFGGTGADLEHVPDNVEFLGWVSDMGSVYSGCSVVVRLVEHDAVGATVAEGLIHARQVIYSYPLPHCTFVQFGDSLALTAALRDIQAQNASGGIPLNRDGREWAIDEFDSDRRFQQLFELLST